MSQVKNERFARLWLASIGPHDSDELVPGSRPRQLLFDLAYSKPARALELVLLIAQRTDDPWKLSTLGAGPLENLLRQNADQTLTALEKQRLPGQREALRSVWTYSFAEETKARLARILSD